MPAVVPFVAGMFSFGAGTAFAAGGAAFAGWTAGAAFAGTIVGSLTVKLLTTVALSALSQALAPDTPQGGGITIETTVQGEHHPETITLGRYATGGQAICPPYSHGKSNKYLTHVIELCSAPGAQLSRLMLGDEWVDLASTATPGEKRVASGKYADLVWLRYHDGTQTAADPWLVETYGTHADRPWTADMVGRGLCYAVLIFQHHTEKLTQVPRYRFELAGIPLYDIRKDSAAGGSGPQRLADPSTWTPTSNPIVMVWNLVRGIPLPGGEVYGGGIADLRRLPRDVWVLAMNRCDAEVVKSGGGTEPAYRAGLEIALDQPPAAAIEELLKAASATIADLGHGWGVVAGAPALPVHAFTDDDVIVSRQQELDPFPGLQDTFNAVGAKFPDPASFWETKEAPQRTNAAWEAADAFGRRMANLSLPAVPYPGQVQRLMRAWIEDERRFRRHVIALPPDSAHVELIDTLDWSSARNGYEGKDWSVHEILEDPRTGIRQFSIRERDPLDYSWRPDFELPEAPGPAAPAPVVPEPVSGYAATAVILRDAGGVARRAGIRQVWDSDIVARGIRWEIRLSGTTEVILRDSTQDIEAGTHTVTAGIMPDTIYEIRARLIKGRDTAWTTWRTVVTQAVAGESVDIPAEVLERIADLEEWAGGTGQDLDAVLDGIEADIDRIDGLVDGVQADLAAEAAALRDEALASLDVAKAYADTGLQSESLARQSETDGLAARIDQLTAALVSEQLLRNGEFADGETWWSRTGTGSVLARDAASADALIRTMPSPAAATIDVGGRLAQNTESFEVSAQDRLQFRFSAGALGSNARQLEVVARWFGATGAEIAPAATHPITMAAGGVWRVQSGRIDPPDTARSAEVDVRHVSASGNRVLVTKVEVTIVNGAVEARVADLEAAQATTAGAVATNRSVTEARFGVNEARIAAEESARASADNAALLRLNALESLTADTEAAIETIETTVAALDQAAATLEQSVSARLGAAEKIRDGVFADGLRHWPIGALGAETDIVARNRAGGWPLNTMPADRALRIANGTPLTRSRRSAPMPVAPGDVIDLSMAYARSPGAVQPRAYLVFLNASGGTIAPPATVLGTGAGAWLSVFLPGIVAPSGAVEVACDIAIGADGTSPAWVTELSARKRQAFEHQAAADVAELKYAMTDPDGAIAGIRQEIETNFANLDSRVTLNATANASRYTKTQTDTAISGAINAFNATLTDRFNAKANASAVSALTARVSNVEGDLEAQSDAITQATARTNRASANGLFRMTTVAAGAGASSRIALIAEAAANQAAQQAGLYIEARTNGRNGVYVVADTFAVVSGAAANAARTAPFIIRGGRAYMDGAEIADLTVGRLQLGEYSASVFPYSLATGGIAATGPERVLASLTLTKGRPDPMPLFFRATMYPTESTMGIRCILRLYRGSTLIESRTVGEWATSTAGNGETICVVDLWTGTSAVTYQLRGQMYARSVVNSSGGPDEFWQLAATGAWNNRFLGAFNAFK